VAVLVPIGEFSKMTYLSVKALRHYHDVGLLEPAAVDGASGYRLYSPAQVPLAQAIRRFRELDMPIEAIRQVLAAPGGTARRDAIREHLRRMQDQLERTRLTVESLQALLADPPPGAASAGPVEHRWLGPLEVVAITATVAFDDCTRWLEAALTELHDRLASGGPTTAPGPTASGGPTAGPGADADGPTAAGPDGAVYDDAFFHEGRGAVTAFVPVAGARGAGGIAPVGGVAAAGRVGAAGGPAEGRAAALVLPAVHVAVMAHDGPFDELDQTYGRLGAYVTERGIAAPGPIREHYPADDRAEVCWPILAG
jgi:DNA-binding transcriptional MerR regulator